MLLSTYFLWCGDWGTTGFLTVTSAVPHTTFSASRLWASSLGIREEISLATVLQDALPALFRKLLPEMGNSCGDLRKRHLSSANNSMLYQQVHCVLIKIQVSGRKGKEREHLLRAGYKAAIYWKSAGHWRVALIRDHWLCLQDFIQLLNDAQHCLKISPAKSRLQLQPQQDCLPTEAPGTAGCTGCTVKPHSGIQ